MSHIVHFVCNSCFFTGGAEEILLDDWLAGWLAGWLPIDLSILF
jgi:hypothetical protein